MDRIMLKADAVARCSVITLISILSVTGIGIGSQSNAHDLRCAITLTKPGRSRASTPRRSEEGSLAFFEEARALVKSQFIYHDRFIDSVFNEVKGWYLTPPEQRMRKVIRVVGMTGTGKSAVIRALVNSLNLGPRFNEFNLESLVKNTDNKNFAKAWRDAINRYYTATPDPDWGFEHISYNIPPDMVVLLDEFHKTFSLELGKPIYRPEMSPMWEMLDGYSTVENSSRLDLEHGLKSDSFRANPPAQYLRGIAEIDARTDITEPEKIQMKANLKIEIQGILRRILNSMNPQITLDLSKSLIFIAMNLDNTFPIHANDREIYPADRLNAISAQVTVEAVDRGLKEKWLSEHLSRMRGATVVVDSYSAKAYQEKIRFSLNAVKAEALANHEVNVEFSADLKDRIFKEIVEPAYGYRGLDGAINAFAHDPLQQISSDIKALRGQYPNVKITVSVDQSDPRNSLWTFRDGRRTVATKKFPIPSSYQLSLGLHADPTRTQVAIALAAQTVVGIQAYRELPLVVRANSERATRDKVIAFPSEGLENRSLRRSQMIDRIAAYLAPLVAEEAMLKERTTGNEENLAAATALAGMLVGTMGLSTATIRGSNLINTNLVKIDGFDSKVDAVMGEATARARVLLEAKKELFFSLYNRLLSEAEVNVEVVRMLAVETWGSPSFEDFLSNPDPYGLAQLPTTSRFSFLAKEHEPIGYAPPK